MTDIERRAILAAAPGKVTYTPGSPPKRFITGLNSQAYAVGRPQITDKQAEALWRHVHAYRRQIRDEQLLAYAARVIDVEKRKQNGNEDTGQDG